MNEDAENVQETQINVQEEIRATSVPTKKKVPLWRRCIYLGIFFVVIIDLLIGTIVNFSNCSIINECLDYPCVRSELMEYHHIEVGLYDTTGFGQKLGRYVYRWGDTLLGKSWLMGIIWYKDWKRLSFTYTLLKERKTLIETERAIGAALAFGGKLPSGKIVKDKIIEKDITATISNIMSGDFFEKDIRQGCMLLQMASRHGDIDAMYLMGGIYSGLWSLYAPETRDKFPEIDEEKAISLLEKVANDTASPLSLHANYLLSRIYLMGNMAVTKANLELFSSFRDETKGMQRLLSSAEKGHLPAARDLCVISHFKKNNTNEENAMQLLFAEIDKSTSLVSHKNQIIQIKKH